MFEQRREAQPGSTAALAAPIVPFEHNPQGFKVVPLQVDEVADYSIVVEVAPQLCLEDTEESLRRKMAILLAPLSKIG